jgi:predicted transcriptional regulator
MKASFPRPYSLGIRSHYDEDQEPQPMEVQLSPDQLIKLSRLAKARGRAAEALVQEAVDQLLSYDEWFSREVEQGLAAADEGEFVGHDAVRRMIDRRYPA